MVGSGRLHWEPGVNTSINILFCFTFHLLLVLNCYDQQRDRRRNRYISLPLVHCILVDFQILSLYTKLKSKTKEIEYQNNAYLHL